MSPFYCKKNIDRVVELVGGGSVINGATPSSLFSSTCMFNLSHECVVYLSPVYMIEWHLSHSPNLPYSKGIGSPAAAILLLKVMYRENLCKGKLKCTTRAPLKSPMNVHIYIDTADQNWFSVVAKD